LRERRPAWLKLNADCTTAKVGHLHERADLTHRIDHEVTTLEYVSTARCASGRSAVFLLFGK
jgi:hypothetical protein